MEDVGRAPGCAIILLTCYKGCFKKVLMKCMYVAFLSNPPPRNLLPDSKNSPSLWLGSVEREMWEGGGRENGGDKGWHMQGKPGIRK